MLEHEIFLPELNLVRARAQNIHAQAQTKSCLSMKFHALAQTRSCPSTKFVLDMSILGSSKKYHASARTFLARVEKIFDTFGTP